MWTLIRRKPRQKKSLRRTLSSVRPRLEALEDRCLLSTPGTLDTTFGSGGTVTTAVTKGNDSAGGVLLQSNGDIIAYGSGSSSFALARYTPSGSLDSTFGSGGIVTTSFGHSGDAINQAALQSDGKIVAVGSGHLVRYNSNGSLDTAFGSNGIVTFPSGVSGSGGGSVLLQPMSDGSEDIVVGAGTVVGNSPAAVLLRYTASGAVDTTFGTGGEVATVLPSYTSAFTYSLALDNGDILAGVGGHPELWAVVAYSASNGSLDTNFGSGGIAYTQVGAYTGISELTNMLVQPDGKIVAVGIAGDLATHSIVWGLARLNSDGSPDSAFGNGGTVLTQVVAGDRQEDAYSLALQSNGEIVVAGAAGGGLALGVYNSDGTPDTTFGSGGFVVQSFNSGSVAYGVAVQPTDGKIVVAGSTTVSSRKSSKNDFFLARYIGTTTPTTATALAATPKHVDNSPQSTPSPLPPSTPAVRGSSLLTDSALSSLTSVTFAPITTANYVSSASPSASGRSGLQATVLDSLERDLSRWENALMQEQAALVKTLDQLFADWDEMIVDSLGSDPAGVRD